VRFGHFFNLPSPSLSRTLIYIHMQVLDGQKLNIGRLQKQIDHVSIMTLVEKYISGVNIMEIICELNIMFLGLGVFTA